MTSKQTGNPTVPQNKERKHSPEKKWDVDAWKRLLVCLICGLAAIVLMVLPLRVLQSFFAKQERSLRDYITANDMSLQPREDFVFLGLDAASSNLDGLDPEVISRNSSLQRMTEPFPWDRHIYADIIDKLAASEAKLIIIDLVFDRSSSIAGDEAFAAAIRRNPGKVVLASAFVVQAEGSEKKVSQVREPNEVFLGPLEDETPFGYINYWPRFEDDLIRRVDFTKTLSEVVDRERHPDDYEYSSLAVISAKQLGKDITETGNSGRFRMARIKRENLDKVYQPVSLYHIFVEQDWQERFQGGEFFRDKIVIIGPADPTLQDLRDTPAGTVHGAQLHLHVLGAILDDAWYQEGFLGDSTLSFLILSLAGLLTGCIIVSSISRPGLLTLALLATVALWYGGIHLIHKSSYTVLGAVPFVYTVGFAVLGSIIWQAITERARRQELYRHLQRSMSPDVADAIVKAPEGYYTAASGNRKQVTVLFADVRGFTERSENQDAAELVSQLNEYLGGMVEEIFEQEGSVDKFIGDAIMATWGGLGDVRIEKDISGAVSAAQGMLSRLSKLNESWQKKGLEPFRIGIGIHHGDAVVGEVGSEQRTDFTVIGDAVNLASRIEGLTKMMGLDLLVSGDLLELFPKKPEWLHVGYVRVKGRDSVVELFTKIDSPDNTQFSDALRAFQQAEFEFAAEMLSRISSASSLAGLTNFYLSQIERLTEKETPPQWDGVLKIDSK